MTGPAEAPAGVATSADEPTVSRRRVLRAVLVVVPLAALAYALLFTAPGLDEAGAALRGLQPRFVALALAGEALHLLAMGQAYRSALAALDVQMAYRRQLAAFVAGYGVGQLLPAGGAVGGAVVGQRMISFGAPRAAAAAAVAFTGTLSLLAVALLVSTGLLVAALVGGSAPELLGVALAAVVVLVALAAVVLAVVRSPTRGHRLLERVAGPLRRIGTDVGAWHRSLDQLRDSPPTLGGLARVVLWAMVAWVGNAGVLWAIFAGLGDALAGDVLLLGFGLQHLVAMIPVSPGGLGLVEAGMAGTYTALGVAGSTAVTGVVGYRIVSFWLPVAIGLTTYLRGVLRDAPTPSAAGAASTGPGEQPPVPTVGGGSNGTGASMTDGIHAPRREPATPSAPADLGAIGRELLQQAHALEAGRSARTLTPGAGAALKQTLLAMVAGTRLEEHQAPGPATIHVLSGGVRLGAPAGTVELEGGQWASIPDEPHDLAATSDAVVLLTVAPDAS